MATTSDRNLEHLDNNVNTITSNDEQKKNERDEEKKSSASSNDNDQGKSTKKVDDLTPFTQADKLSSVESTNEDMKSSKTPSTSDTNAEKHNEGNTIETGKSSEKNEESGSKPDSSPNKQLDSTSQSAGSDSKKDQSKNNFVIEKGEAQYLTDFQRQKAKYFFNVNLDIENKEYVTWEDVEFYLLFHLTAVGKEGSDGGDLEGRLSRATRAFWEFVHDQIPSSDGKRDQLTLDQFLDTWASLIDYIVRTNQLPGIIQDLVKLGFELYATDNNDGKPATIQPIAFDQLFQKMNLGRPYAIMAYKFLTENGTKPLDEDKIESLVKAVITSSDDEHDSHFLLPGFFKIISSNKEKEKEKTSPSSSPIPDKIQSDVNDTSSSTKSKPDSQPEKSSPSASVSTTETQKPSEVPSSSSSQQQANSIPQNESQKPSTVNSSTNSEQKGPAPSETPAKNVIQTEDDNIRSLLRFYHIDDGDFVEVAGGSVERVVLLHPERPVPPYIQHNPQLLEKLRRDAAYVSNGQSNKLINNNEKLFQPTTSKETKPKVTLEERITRGEAHVGPSMPSNQESKQGIPSSSSSRIRQVYPPLSETQQEELQKQAKLQAAARPVQNEKKATDATRITNDVHPSESDKTKEKTDISRVEEEKIVANVIKQIVPIIEKQVAKELRRIQSGDTDQDEDDGFMPFPFMFAGAGNPFFVPPTRGPPPKTAEQQQQTSELNAANQREQTQQGNGPTEPDFGGLPPGAAFIPPQLLMAMMSDLARGAMGGEIPIFAGDMPPPPPPRGPGGIPTGVEGFMMFVDDNPMMGGPAPGYPPRPGPRF